MVYVLYSFRATPHIASTVRRYKLAFGRKVFSARTTAQCQTKFFISHERVNQQDRRPHADRTKQIGDQVVPHDHLARQARRAGEPPKASRPPRAAYRAATIPKDTTSTPKNRRATANDAVRLSIECRKGLSDRVQAVPSFIRRPSGRPAGDSRRRIVRQQGGHRFCTHDQKRLNDEKGLGLYSSHTALLRIGRAGRMVAERRDPRMVSASGKTCADAAQCGISHRMEHHLPLHGPLRRTGSDLRLAPAPESYDAMVRTTWDSTCCGASSSSYAEAPCWE